MNRDLALLYWGIGKEILERQGKRVEDEGHRPAGQGSAPEFHSLHLEHGLLPQVDDTMRHPGDKPSIGLILCKSKNRFVAEYAIRDIAKPLGVAEFRYLDQLKGTLPTIEEIEAELEKQD